MAVTVNNVTNGSTLSGVAITVSSSVGNLSVVAIDVGAGDSVTSVVDSKGNTYLLAVSNNFAALGTDCIYYSPSALTGITTVTITFTGSVTTGAYTVYDCSGASANPLVNSDFIEGNGGGSVGTTNPVGPTVNYNIAGGLVVSVITGSAGVSAVASPFTFDGSYGTIGSGFAHYSYSTPGIFTPSWTSGSGSWNGVAALFASSTGTNNIRFSKGKSTVSAGTITTSPITTSIGDLIVVTCADFGGTSSSPVFTDSKGNTFTLVPTINPFTGGIGAGEYIGYCVLTSAGTNHTFTFNANPNVQGPMFVVALTSSITPTLSNKGAVYTSSSGTTFTGVSCSPVAGDFILNWIDVQDGVESSFTANGLWQLGVFELDGNNYAHPFVSAYQFNAVGGSTSDNISVSPNAAPALEMLVSFTIQSSLYPSDMTPGTNVVFEVG